MATPDLTALDEERLGEWLLGQPLVRLEGARTSPRRTCSTSSRSTTGRRRSRSPPSRRASRPGRTTIYQLLLGIRAGGRRLDRRPRSTTSAASPSTTPSPTRRRPRSIPRLLRRGRHDRGRARDRRVPLGRRVRPPAARRRPCARWAPSSPTARSCSTTRSCSRLFRRLEAGGEPRARDAALPDRAAASRTSPSSPAGIAYSGELMDATLGVVQQLRRAAARDGWELALDELGADPEAFVARMRRARRA